MFKEKITILLATILISSTSLVNGEENKINNLILGGRYLEEAKIEQEIEADDDEESYSLERFFRPSNTPILNTKRNLLSIDDYNKNPSDITLIVDYAKFIGKYSEFTSDFEKWEDEDLTTEEAQYYVDVQARVTKKLLEVNG